MTTKVIGQSVLRVDALDKVTGRTHYPGDLTTDDVLYMKELFAGRPHARVLSVDTGKALAAPGVLAVFTSEDVPVNDYGLMMPDQPVLCGPGGHRPGLDVVRNVGDQVALVVAETERQAAAALDLIDVEYEDLPFVVDPHEAMKPGAVLVHEDRQDNVLTHWLIRKGDAEAAFAEADVIIEGEYETPMQEHAYLQPEAGLAYVDDRGVVTVQVGGQEAHRDAAQIARSLGLEDDQVRVIYPATGGAFGGREDMSVQIILGLAVWRLHQRGINRPVFLFVMAGKVR